MVNTIVSTPGGIILQVCSIPRSTGKPDSNAIIVKGVGCMDSMTRFYDEDELKGALIYDSMGLEYGLVSGLLYERDDVYLVASARQGGRKGLVPSSEIMAITQGDDKLIILLSKPRELEYRGLPSDYGVPTRLPKPSEIRGLPVVSLGKGYLGRVESIVVGPGTPGIRVSRLSSRVVQWLSFITALKRQGSVEEAEKLSNTIDPLKHPRVPFNEAVRALEEAGLTGLSSILSRFTTRSGDSVDLPFSMVKRITDIVIVE